MLEGETTQKKRKPKKTFFLHPKPAAPPGPRPFDSSLSAENQELSPPLSFLFFSFFSSRQWRLGGDPYFFSSPATPERGDFF